VANPVTDAEGAEFGEVAVIKDENKVARLIAEGLDNMTMAAREYQISPGSKSLVSAQPWGSMTVVRTRPSVTKAHSAAVACQ
jgi:hypothetical protein